jgi:hypothetical protein
LTRIGDFDWQFTAMNFDFKRHIFHIIKLSFGKTILFRQNITNNLSLTDWNFSLLISQKYRWLGMFNCLNRYNVVTSLTKLFMRSIHNQPIFIITMVTKLLVFNLILLQKFCYLQRLGFIQIYFDLPIFLQRNYFKCFLREMSECKVPNLSLFHVGIS